jgi:hypothetical protein
MINNLRAEFCKLLTVRSTYIISLLALILTGILTFSFTRVAIMFSSDSLESGLAGIVVAPVSIFTGIVAILLICHEYRYNTISYTLTSTASRLRVLCAKLIVIAVYAAVMAIAAMALIAGCFFLGAAVNPRNAVMMHQDVHLYSIMWRVLAYTIMGSWAGLLFGFLSRSVVFSIVAFLIIPSTIEPLLSGLLKVSPNYLPFSAQIQILMTPTSPDAFSHLASAGIFLAYLVAGWLIAADLFVRRDAN